MARADMLEFYGKPLENTVRALSLLLDGEVQGIIGIEHIRGGQKFFADYTDELERNLRNIAVYRAIKMVMGWVEASPLPVGAVAEHEEGRRLLERLGFTRIYGNQYQWLGPS